MKLSELKNIIREVILELDEQSSTGTGASFTPGTGAQYATPYAFSKNNAEKIGYKVVKTKKRPYNTKMFDYLDENDTRKI